MTLDEFVESAPAELLQDLVDLFENAASGRYVSDDFVLADTTQFYRTVAARLRERIASN